MAGLSATASHDRRLARGPGELSEGEGDSGVPGDAPPGGQRPGGPGPDPPASCGPARDRPDSDPPALERGRRCARAWPITLSQPHRGPTPCGASGITSWSRARPFHPRMRGYWPGHSKSTAWRSQGLRPHPRTRRFLSTMASASPSTVDPCPRPLPTRSARVRKAWIATDPGGPAWARCRLFPWIPVGRTSANLLRADSFDPTRRPMGTRRQLGATPARL